MGYFRIVAFGSPNPPLPRGVYPSLATAKEMFWKWADTLDHSLSSNSDELIYKHNIRINEYDTRAAANDGDISDSWPNCKTLVASYSPYNERNDDDG